MAAADGTGPDGWWRVTPTLRIPSAELEWRTTRPGGPGGQHANTADTRVEVRFRVETSTALGPGQRARLLARLGPVVSAVAADTRSQARNREIALERLRERLAAGLAVPRVRRPTRPGRGAREARLDAKRRRGDTKRGRGRPASDD